MRRTALPAWSTDRRSALVGMGAILAAGCVPLKQDRENDLAVQLGDIEAAVGGSLGVHVFDTGKGSGFGWRQQERFPHASSFKLSLAALVLALDESGDIDADEAVRWTKADLLAFSPFTTERVEEGATLRELARAIAVYSDNAAANILLRRIGGPPRVTAFWRTMSDTASRLDNFEYELNNVPEGEVHDTTTPEAMSRTVARLLYGDVLRAPNQQLLRGWAIESATGLRRIRAGLPAEWPAGDKTGTSGSWPGMGSVHADIGFVEPPGRAPLTFAAYHRADRGIDGADPAIERALSQVGKVLASYARA